MSTYHTPVMLKEVAEGLEVREGKNYIDATIGGGGHSVEILKRGGRLLGIDADPEAIEFARENLKSSCEAGSRLAGQISNLKEEKDWKIIQGNFREIGKIARENGCINVDGIVFDLGVSSHQLDTSARGFSYRFAQAPLDLRLDQTQGTPASDIVNTFSKDELYEIFARFGEEQLAGAIADVIIRTRRMKPIQTTGGLVAVVSQVVKNSMRLRATLSRVFQALRIATNDELTNIREGLAQAYDVLAPQGRLAVISFHSLEDRIVKQTMADGRWKSIAKTPVRPSEFEIEANPRCQSSKLRIAEKL